MLVGLKNLKNHVFMIELIKALREKSDKYYLVLVGDGSLRESVENLTKENGVDPYVKFMGTRLDIPEIMSCLFDIFIFPSLWEGLPLTLVEAQFAGLKCFISDKVSSESDISSNNYLSINNVGFVGKQDSCFHSRKKFKWDFSNCKFNITFSMSELNKEYGKPRVESS